MAARYVTTDLNLRARFDLRPLVQRLEESGLVCLGEPRARGGVWSASLEAGGVSGKIGREIGELLAAVESLDGEERLAWDRCLAREFDLGFERGGEDLYSDVLVEPALVQRIAALGGAVRVTICREAEPPNPA